MAIDYNGLAALTGAAATLAATLGGLRWQDRRPTSTDQARAYRSVRRAAGRAVKLRAKYDDAVRDLDRARAVADAVDVERVGDPQPEQDPVLSAGAALVEQMNLQAERMEDAVDDFAELVARQGAQTARAVVAITGQQPAVAPARFAGPPGPPPAARPVTAQPVPSGDEGALPRSPRSPAPPASPLASGFGSWRREQPAETDPETGPLATFDELWNGEQSPYRPPRERGER